MRPSANGRKARVAAAWPAPSPPMPGVSTSTRPFASSGLGHGDVDPLDRPWRCSGFPASVTQSGIEAGSIVLDDGLVALVVGAPGRPVLAVAEQGDRRGGEIVVDRANGLADEGVRRASSCPA